MSLNYIKIGIDQIYWISYSVKDVRNSYISSNQKSRPFLVKKLLCTSVAYNVTFLIIFT